METADRPPSLQLTASNEESADQPITSNQEPADLPPLTKEKYYVQYYGNSSKRWDGKVIVVDGSWLEGLYAPSELVPGKELSLPYTKKGGVVQNWKAVVVLPAANPSPATVAKPAPPAAVPASGKGIFCLLAS